MKLRKLYLQAFGKFVDTSFVFSPRINLVYGSNEAGKSTLGEFIFSMLYGQKKYGVKRRIYLDSYEKYMPWNHSLYKGILHYSIGQDLYRIDRDFLGQNEDIQIFNDKTGQQINALYKIDARKELQFLLEQIGLNQNNFKNTIYVTQNDIEGYLHKNKDSMFEELLGKVVYGIDGENPHKTTSEIIHELEKTKKKIGTISSKSKPLGSTYKNLQEKLKRKYYVENKIQSYYKSQKKLKDISEKLEYINERKTSLEAQKNYLEKRSLQDKIHRIEKLLTEKEDLINYTSKNFPANIEKQSIKGIYNQRKRLQDINKILVIIGFISLLSVIFLFSWQNFASLLWVRIFIRVFFISCFIGCVIKWKNNVGNEDKLLVQLETISRYQESKKELIRLQTEIQNETSQYSLMQLKTKVNDIEESKIIQVPEEKKDRYSLDAELEALNLEEMAAIREKAYIEAKIQEYDLKPLELEEVERDIIDLENHIKDLEGDIQAIDIAIDTIKTLEEGDKAHFLPYVIKKAEENIYKITKKYNTIKIDDEYGVKTIDPESQKIIPLEKLSQGTFNQFYFALRMSLIDALSPETIYLPIILDEPFVHFDNQRFEESMELLEKLSQRHQVIIFTSQDREKKYLDKNKKDYNYLKL